MTNRWLTLDEAAEAVGRTRRTIDAWVSKGLLSTARRSDGKAIVREREVDGIDREMRAKRADGWKRRAAQEPSSPSS